MKIFSKFPDVSDFPHFPANSNFGRSLRQIPDWETYLIHSNVMILLILPLSIICYTN